MFSVTSAANAEGVAGRRQRATRGLTKEICAAIAKVRPAFDVSSTAQVGAIASLTGDDADAELERRRSYNAVAVAELGRILRAFGLETVGPAVANFLYVDLGTDSRPFFESLLEQGVVVRPLHSLSLIHI